ncbi:unnamed protein product [Pleuronectes platessa]|uniref:Uncharacterized protein n=1 Tax=Pleuronectes platessa TaxID=8262 RepID=A0A9N7Z8I6_PLEPL|nr:unnamed protein product [Pleuronectes platessa]
MLQPSAPLYSNAKDAARRMHAALLRAHNSRHSVLQSPKDAGIGQGHPQIDGDLCRLSTNLKVGGREGGGARSPQIPHSGDIPSGVDGDSSKHFPKQQPLRGSSALRLDETLPRLRLRLRLRLRHLRSVRCRRDGIQVLSVFTDPALQLLLAFCKRLPFTQEPIDCSTQTLSRPASEACDGGGGCVRTLGLAEEEEEGEEEQEEEEEGGL